MRTVGAVLAPWRFASRLARREVRRHPGRTILVALLVAVPVMGMTIFSVLSRTLDGDDSWQRRFPDGTDLVVAQPLDSRVDFGEHIPDDASVRTAVGSDSVPIETASGSIVDDVSIFDSAPIGESGSVYSLSTGERPERGEVWLSTALANELGVSVGDEVPLQHPSGTWTVSGVGRDRNDFERNAMVVPDLDVRAFREGAVMRWTFVDLGNNVPASEVSGVAGPLSALVNEDTDGGWVNWEGQSFADGSVEVTSLAWGWVAGTISLAATGIIVAGAFATSARRQLTTIGLLSSNGASEGLTRRTLALQGLWTGVIGSLSGVVIAVGLLLAGRSTIERARDRALLPYQFNALDLTVIAITGIAAATIAALVPARTASRVPVMTALAGRRPLGAVPRRLVPIGLGLFALGVFLMFVAASADDGNAAAAAAVLGGVSVLAGVCCCSPLAIDTMSRVAARLGGSWRFAGRSLGRTRTRSAAVVTAIAVTGALAMAGSAVAEKIDDGGDDGRQVPADAVVFASDFALPDDGSGVVDLDVASDQPIDESQREAINEVVPTARWHDRRIATWDPPPVAVEELGLMPPFRSSFVVADEAMMDLYELTAGERAALQETGLLVLQGWVLHVTETRPFDTLRNESITIATEDGDVTLPYAARDHVSVEYESYVRDGSYDADFDGIYGIDDFMITQEAARAAGLEIVVSGAFLRSDAPLTEAQRSSLEDLRYGSEGHLGYAYRDVPLPAGATIAFWHSPDWTPPPFVVQASIVGAALLLTLLVVAIGLALAATESHDERDVLVAVGARPGTMRSMAGAKATVITMTGVVLAVPAGLVPIAVMMRALDEHFEMPWPALGGLLIVVPLIAGGAAWLVSSIAQRARPPHMSGLAFE